MPLSNEILQLLEKIRSKAISVRDVSKETGIPEQRIYNWKNKGINPSSHTDVEKLQAYAEAHQYLLQDAAVEYGGGRLVALERRVEELETEAKSLQIAVSILLGEVASIHSLNTGEPVGSILLRLKKAGLNASLFG